MDPITAALMSIGTGSAAGLRPYFTIFFLSLAGIAVPDTAPGWISNTAGQIPDSLANPVVLVICGVLALGNSIFDKILGVNLPFETINQILRPAVGALLGAQLGMEAGGGAAVTSGLLGIGAATPVSLGKASLTAGLTAIFPEPVSQVVRSVIEDFGALGMIVLVLLLPVIAALLGIILVLIGIGLFFLFRKALRVMRTKFSEIKQRRDGLQTTRLMQKASGTTRGALESLRRLATGEEIPNVEYISGQPVQVSKPSATFPESNGSKDF